MVKFELCFLLLFVFERCFSAPFDRDNCILRRSSDGRDAKICGLSSSMTVPYGYSSSYSLPVSSWWSTMSAGGASHLPPVSVSSSASAAIHQLVPDVTAVASQAAVTKPAVAQVVEHRPEVREDIRIIRQQVIGHVDEIIHRPFVTELEQEIRRPLYTEHRIHKPVFSSSTREIVKAPLHLTAEQYHLVTKPETNVIRLPVIYVKPTTTEVIQTPVISHQIGTVNNVHYPSLAAVSAFTNHGSEYQSSFLMPYGCRSGGCGDVGTDAQKKDAEPRPSVDLAGKEKAISDDEANVTRKSNEKIESKAEKKNGKIEQTLNELRTLSEDERTAILDVLKNEVLMENISNNSVQDSVVGENAKSVFEAANSR